MIICVTSSILINSISSILPFIRIALFCLATIFSPLRHVGVEIHSSVSGLNGFRRVGVSFRVLTSKSNSTSKLTLYVPTFWSSPINLLCSRLIIYDVLAGIHFKALFSLQDASLIPFSSYKSNCMRNTSPSTISYSAKLA